MGNFLEQNNSHPPTPTPQPSIKICFFFYISYKQLKQLHDIA